MNGEWICSVTPNHICEVPSLDDAPTPQGAVWQCECGQYWLGLRHGDAVEWRRCLDNEVEWLKHLDENTKPKAD